MCPRDQVNLYMETLGWLVFILLVFPYNYLRVMWTKERKTRNTLKMGGNQSSEQAFIKYLLCMW